MNKALGSRFFYGYVIVSAAWLAMFVSSGAQNSFGIFLPALSDEFGWTRGMLSLGLTLNVALMAVLGILAGYLTDRIGPRWTVVIGAIIGATGIGLLSTVNEIWQFILFYGVITPLGISMSYMIATVTTVRRWFMRRAALMVSIAMVGSGLGIVLLMPAADQMISAWGWRQSYIAFALILAVGAVIAGLLLKRDPESSGTYPDGVQPSLEEMAARADFASRSEHWSIKEALRTRSWWLLVFSQFFNIAVIGLLAHLIIWGNKDVGIDLGTMVLIYSFGFVLAAVVGRLFAGYISDWYMARFGISRKPILYVCVLGVALGCFLAVAVSSMTALIPVVLLLGFCYGCGMPVFPTYLGDLFGVTNLPLLFGAMALFVAGIGAVGPVLYGFIYDATGAYDLAFIITGILCLISGVCLFLLRPPVKATASDA